MWNVKVRDQQNEGRGRGRGRPNDSGGPNFGANPRGSRPDVPEIQYAVPANKCGLVIGKGGETIKNINQVSGAYVTLSALPSPNAQEKVFVIRGQPPQIEHAKELINERIGGVGTVIQSPENPQNQQNFSPQFPQQLQFQQLPSQTQPYAPQGWANAYQLWQGQVAAAADPKTAKESLKIYSEMNGLELEYYTKGQDYHEVHGFLCTLKLGYKMYHSYPELKPTAEFAEEAAAKKAMDAIKEKKVNNNNRFSYKNIMRHRSFNNWNLRNYCNTCPPFTKIKNENKS